MKKLIAALLAVLLLAAALTGCASGPDKIYYDYDTVLLFAPCRTEGSLVTLIFSEDLSTNFRWTCEQTEGSLEPVYEQFVTDRDKHMVYSDLSKFNRENGVHLWQFRAKKACEAVFEVTQINVTTGGAIKTETVRVSVDKKGNARWK
ncbi:MAG: protease inhibitor I42 family protein [Oscillospiraceae bacterium]|nr:protease inhibitor I42 family protein [Oscillospiraceae bacterium]